MCSKYYLRKNPSAQNIKAFRNPSDQNISSEEIRQLKKLGQKKSSSLESQLRGNPTKSILILLTTDFHLAFSTPGISLTPSNFTDFFALVEILCPTGRFKM